MSTRISRGRARVRRLPLSVRMLMFSALLVLAAQAPGPAPSGDLVAQACNPASLNEIVCENQLAGAPDTEWDITGAGSPDIQGFATDMSVNKGDEIQFKVRSNAAFTMKIYRLGWYGGMGARLVATL